MIILFLAFLFLAVLYLMKPKGHLIAHYYFLNIIFFIVLVCITDSGFLVLNIVVYVLYAVIITFLTIYCFSRKLINKSREFVLFSFSSINYNKFSFIRRTILALSDKGIFFFEGWHMTEKQSFDLQEVELIYLTKYIPNGIRLKKDKVCFFTPFPKAWKREIERLYYWMEEA